MAGVDGNGVQDSSSSVRARFFWGENLGARSKYPAFLLSSPSSDVLGSTVGTVGGSSSVVKTLARSAAVDCSLVQRLKQSTKAFASFLGPTL